MPQSEKFEVLVLGSGTGGKLIAWYMAQSGQRTAVGSGPSGVCSGVWNAAPLRQTF
jgi:pyruvate/2-oxoglutarate dehydrogenase complex dihydrolipoamide dehydrogenase (E3) component